MNWRVTVLLRRLLEHAGVEVILARKGFDDPSLSERAQVANDANADLFISIHHNAGGKTANYTSVWFHGEADWSEPDIDMARYIAHALGEAMRTDVAVIERIARARETIQLVEREAQISQPFDLRKMVPDIGRGVVRKEDEYRMHEKCEREHPCKENTLWIGESSCPAEQPPQHVAHRKDHPQSPDRHPGRDGSEVRADRDDAGQKRCARDRDAKRGTCRFEEAE